MPSTTSRHIFLVTQGTLGDVLPFALLAKDFVDLGCRVTVVTHSPYRQLIESSGAAFAPSDLPGDYDNYLVAMKSMLNLRPSNLAAFYDEAGLFALFESELKALLGTDGGPALVVGHHTCALSGRVAAEISHANYVSVALEPSQIAAAAVTGMFFGKGVGHRLNDYRRKYGLQEVTKWGAWMERADLLAGLWPEWFDRAGPRSPDRSLLVGFPYADELVAPAPVPLDDADRGRQAAPSVVVSGGTSRLLHPDFYRAAINGIAEAGLVATVVAPFPELLPALPDGFTARATASRNWLAGATLVVHAGGIGTVARSARQRVPQLVLAHGVGRPDNAARAQNAGIGQALLAQDWSSGTVAVAAKHCMALQPNWPEENAGPAGATRSLALACMALSGSGGQ